MSRATSTRQYYIIIFFFILRVSLSYLIAVPADGDLIILDFWDDLFFSSYLFLEAIPSADLLLQMMSSLDFSANVFLSSSTGVEMIGTRDFIFGAPFDRGFVFHSSSLF